ncbi:MAG TPA: TolC family protein [Vicinamibacterales bacterium]|nr:TolC family protein [Vicinamibacterales bacterium]
MNVTRRARACAVAIGLVSGLVGRASAQRADGALTIDAAVREAIDHNLTLIAERYSVSVADARIVTAGLRPNPVVTVSTLLPSTELFDNGVSPREEIAHVDVPIERGGKREYRLDVARAAKSVAELQLMNTVRQLALDVQSACVDVVQAKQNLALARESLDAFNALVQINTERVRTGDLSQVELSRSRLAALQFQNDVRQQQAKLTVAQGRLRTLLGRIDAAPIEVDDNLRRDSAAVDRDAVQRLAIAQRPDLEALRRDQARSTADLRLQEAQGKVDFTLSGEFHHQYQPLPAPAGAGGALYGLFLSSPLPLFNRNQGEIARAQLEEKQTTARIAAYEAQVRTEVDAAYEAYTAARDVVSTIEAQMLARARDVRSATEYSYRRGEASFVEFLDAVRAFNDTMQSYNAARADYARSLYTLDASAGGAGVHP